MPFSKERRRSTLNGILFVALFAAAAIQIAQLSWLQNLGLSPLIVGILLGMVYANTLRSHVPAEWVPGIVFSSKTILRTAVVLYGFRVTFQQIGAVGLDGILVSVTMVTTTFLLGSFVGQKVLKLDRDTTLLTTAGSSVCGAAAVLATEPVLKAEAYKSAIAVSTVVIFGTLSMFLYPILQTTGLLHLSQTHYGLYIGGSVHEVAQVVGAGAAVGAEATRVAVIVKMTRVMLLAPLLLILGLVLSLLARRGSSTGNQAAIKLVIPWFAVGFIAVSGFHSLNWLPGEIVGGINTLDTFLLTMAMSALGMETSLAKFKQAGAKPFILGLVLFGWLILGGYGVTWLVTRFA